MIGNPNRVNQNPHCRQGKKPNLRSNGRGPTKNGRPVREAAANTRHMQAAQNSNVAEKKLSSRKIVWLEKIKLHLSIFACNARLKLGLYNNILGRQALKISKQESEQMLKNLKSEAVLKVNEERFKEAVEDGENFAAITAGLKIAGHYIKQLPDIFRS